MLKYLRYSNLKLSVDLNPFAWGFNRFHQEPTSLAPNLHIRYFRILFLSIIISIDNGLFYEEQLPNEEIGELTDLK